MDDKAKAGGRTTFRWRTLHMYCSYSLDFFEFVELTIKLNVYSKTFLSKVYKAYPKTYLLP